MSRFRVFVLLAFLARPTAAAAQTRPADLAVASLADLMKISIVTTASLASEHLAKAPARMDVITAEQIERRAYRSLADVLKDLPDFKVDLGGDSDYPTQLTVQGTPGSSLVVLLLDGIRISAPTGEPLPILANYPVHNARQIEIVYGPASALYGADAFSAVINIISKDATQAEGLSVGVEAGQFGLHNQTATYGARLGKASLVISGQLLTDRQPDLSKYYPGLFGDMAGQRTGVFNSIFGPMASPRPVPSAYENPLSAHSVQSTLRAGAFRLQIFESRSQEPSAASTNPDNTVYSSEAFNRNNLFVAAGVFTHTVRAVTLTSTVSFSRHELAPESGYWNVYSNFDRSYKYAYGSEWKGEEQLSWQPGSRVTITAGGTFEHFFSIPQGADLNAPITSHDAPGTILDTNIVDEFFKIGYRNLGGYGQLQFDASPRVALTVGLRADDNSRFGATANPRVGLVLQPAGGTTIKLLYGTAYLAPSPYQEYAHFGSFSSTDGGATFRSAYWHLPNPNLKPQHKHTLEASARQALGASIGLSASAFYSRVSNLIQQSDASQSYAGLFHGWPVDYIDFPVNEGRQVSFGGTIGLDYLRTLGDKRRLGAHVGLSAADGHVWNSDSPTGALQLGNMTPVQLRAGFEFDWGSWTLSPRLTTVGTQRAIATEVVNGSTVRRTLPGYSTVDVNIRRHLAVRGVDLFVTVENVFDKRYVNLDTLVFSQPEVMIGAPQNPRRLIVGLDVRIH